MSQTQGKRPAPVFRNKAPKKKKSIYNFLIFEHLWCLCYIVLHNPQAVLGAVDLRPLGAKFINKYITKHSGIPKSSLR